MEQNKIWDYYQNAKHRDDFSLSLPRYRFLAARINHGEMALNIGVGRGGLETLLVGKGVKVSCLDPSETSIQAIRQRLNLSDNARVGHSQEIPFADQTFDVVVMTEVLEHLDDGILLATLQEVRRVLKPGGRFIGTVPANEALESLQVVCPCCGEVFHKWGHVQSFSPERLAAVMQGAGFADSNIQYRAFPDWRRPGPVNLAKSTGRYLLGRLGHPVSLPSLYFVCKH